MDYILVGLICLSIGIGIGVLIKTWIDNKRSFVGTIVTTTKAEGVKSYSLELENVDILESKDEVVFRVKNSEDS